MLNPSSHDRVVRKRQPEVATLRVVDLFWRLTACFRLFQVGKRVYLGPHR